MSHGEFDITQWAGEDHELFPLDPDSGIWIGFACSGHARSESVWHFVRPQPGTMGRDRRHQGLQGLQVREGAGVRVDDDPKLWVGELEEMMTLFGQGCGPLTPCRRRTARAQPRRNLNA
ncbi:MAG: hypothetical protein MH204_08235 [Fimbriimonadaceae bacterium]|nr:hypothetical protein [Fimbriimonadaceae bacterium]